MTKYKRLSLLLLSFCLAGCAGHTLDYRSFSEGDSLFQQGQFAAALQAWPVVSEAGDASLLLRQVRAYQGLGQARDALRLAEQAVQHAQPAEKAESLIALAESELMLAMQKHAQTHLQQAALWVENKPRLQIKLAVAEARLALLDKRLGDAVNRYAEAEKTAVGLGDELLRQEMAVGRWAVLQQLKFENLADNQSLDDSPLSGEQTADLQRTIKNTLSLPASPGKDFIAIKLAHILLNLGSEPAAIEQLLEEATASSRQRGDQRLLSYALGYLGQAAENRRQYAMALGYTNQAAFAAQQVGAPEMLYLWEWQTARIMQRLERPDEALAAYRRAVFNLQAVRSDLGVGSAFREKVAPLFQAFSDLLLKTARQESDRDQANRLLKEVRDVLEQQKAAELQDYFQDRCVANFKAKTKTLEEISPHTAVLYPILLNDRMEMLVGFSDGLQQFAIPVGKQKLTQEIHNFRRKLEKRTTYQYLAHAKQLYQWLIAPVLPELHAHQIDTLVIVPDGPLRSIPLSALYDNRRYLIEEFAVSTTPGLALTDPQPLPQEQLTVLLNGLTVAVQQFPALPDVEQELDEIRHQYGGTLLKNGDFRLDALANAMEKTPYRIVHIASHGQFDRDPSKTFLLTYDDKLNMDLLERYISAGKYREAPVELLTLSACQTAAGDDRAALGLAGVAVKAGARSALASLWFINDQASSLLVGNFYRQLHKRQSKAQALRLAQQELLNDPRYRHASYWSPFLLIGNWL